MEEQLAQLRKQLLTFRWVGIGLGFFAFPAPLVFSSITHDFTGAFLSVPICILGGLGCMIAGIVTRGKIKELRSRI